MLRLIIILILAVVVYNWSTSGEGQRFWANLKHQGIRTVAEQVWCGEVGCPKSHERPVCTLDANNQTVCTPISKSR